MRSFSVGSALTILAVATLSAQQQPAIRQLGPVVATSSETFGPTIVLRHLKNGVLVNDMLNRRLLLLDKDLANPAVVADTTPATGNAYAGRTGGLLAYRGDSSLFVDPASLSMLVIAPDGKLTSKVMSVPRSQDVGFMASAAGNANMDNAGRVVYRGMPAFNMPRPTQSANGTTMFQPPDMPDSTAVVRINVSTRVLDTVGFIKIPKIKMDVQSVDGRTSIRSIANPLPVVDEFAVLSDGSIAMIRGRDYHIDWVRPDGTRESTPKIPFDWRRLSDEDKVAFLDSVKAQRERMGPNAPMPAGMGGTPNINMQIGGGPGGPGGGAGQRTMVMGGGDGPQPRPRPDGAAGGAGGPTIVQGPGAAGGAGMAQQPLLFVNADELPDYQPVFFSGAARADADGRLWIRTVPTKALPGGPVYDVINTKGELVERVQVPEDRLIVGFGVGGVVYLRVGATNKIEKASVK
jgi:hypothetical protein